MLNDSQKKNPAYVISSFRPVDKRKRFLNDVIGKFNLAGTLESTTVRAQCHGQHSAVLYEAPSSLVRKEKLLKVRLLTCHVWPSVKTPELRNACP